MLTEVKAYSSWRSAPTLPLDALGAADTDLIQVRNIAGLEPVKAAVNTSPHGAVDGSSYTGASVPSRNIVLTLGLNPNWDDWSYEALRDLLYLYFMPKRPTRLVFYRDDKIPVEIYGIVESVETVHFSSDPEVVVSVICPDPYFTAIDETVLTGQTIRPDGASIVVDYEGTIETGILVKVTYVSGASPTDIGIQVGDTLASYFDVEASVDATSYFDMSSIPMYKYVQNVSIGTGVITNLLSKVQEGFTWPLLQPGDNDFYVVTDQGVQDWELVYFEKYGGL